MEKSDYIESAELFGLKTKIQRDVFACFLEFQVEVVGSEFSLVHEFLLLLSNSREIPDDPLDIFYIICLVFPMTKINIFKLIRLYLDEYGQIE